MADIYAIADTGQILTPALIVFRDLVEANIDRMMAELMGKETGYCRGLGGSMHIADMDLNILGANGIVGAGMPLGIETIEQCYPVVPPLLPEAIQEAIEEEVEALDRVPPTPIREAPARKGP